MGLVSRYLDDRAVQANDADTYRKLLPANAKISAIDLRIEITNGATSGTQQIIDALTTLNVFDGAYPIFSVFPRTALAIHALVTQQRAPQLRDESAAAVQELFIRIPFGRKLGDREYFLDTSQWKNPEIRIPYAPTISATAFATGTVTITTRLHYWDGVNPPGSAKGYYRWVEAVARTSLASGAFQAFLPLDLPLIGVMAFSRVAGTAYQTNLTRIRILDNPAGTEVKNIRSEDLFASNHESYGLEAIERGIAFRQDNGTIDTDCNFLQSHSLEELLTQTTSTDVLKYTYKSYAGDRVTLSGLKIADSAGTIGAAALDTTNRGIRWSAEGRGLPHAVYVDLDGWEDPSLRYQFPQAARPIIEFTEGGSGSTQKITTVQLGSPSAIAA